MFGRIRATCFLGGLLTVLCFAAVPAANADASPAALKPVPLKYTNLESGAYVWRWRGQINLRYSRPHVDSGVDPTIDNFDGASGELQAVLDGRGSASYPTGKVTGVYRGYRRVSHGGTSFACSYETGFAEDRLWDLNAKGVGRNRQNLLISQPDLRGNRFKGPFLVRGFGISLQYPILCNGVPLANIPYGIKPAPEGKLNSFPETFSLEGELPLSTNGAGYKKGVFRWQGHKSGGHQDAFNVLKHEWEYNLTAARVLHEKLNGKPPCYLRVPKRQILKGDYAKVRYMFRARQFGCSVELKKARLKVKGGRTFSLYAGGGEDLRKRGTWKATSMPRYEDLESIKRARSKGGAFSLEIIYTVDGRRSKETFPIAVAVRPRTGPPPSH